MTAADTKPPLPARMGVAVLVLFLHLAVLAALVRAFAPRLGEAVVSSVTQAVEITLPLPEPAPEPPSNPVRSPPVPRQIAQSPGAAAPVGRKASAREVAAPQPKVALSRVPAPALSGQGNADSVGAADRGLGTGAGGAGQGTGSGSAGTGTGGGAKAVKIAGDINSARDYPKQSRARRIGTSVTIALTVGAEGRVTNCRVLRPSGDPDADRITCRLASERFRFRPARDGAGRAVESVYGWQQRWFTPAPN